VNAEIDLRLHGLGTDPFDDPEDEEPDDAPPPAPEQPAMEATP